MENSVIKQLDTVRLPGFPLNGRGWRQKLAAFYKEEVISPERTAGEVVSDLRTLYDLTPVKNRYKEKIAVQRVIRSYAKQFADHRANQVWRIEKNRKSVGLYASVWSKIMPEEYYTIYLICNKAEGRLISNYDHVNSLIRYLKGVNPDDKEKVYAYAEHLLPFNEMKAFWKSVKALLPEEGITTPEETQAFIDDVIVSGKFNEIRDRIVKEARTS